MSRLSTAKRTLQRSFRLGYTRAYQWLTPRLNLQTLSTILVLGNQKTGSTAIAELLARAGDLRAATDLHPLQDGTLQVENHPEQVATLIHRLQYYFEHAVVKENELTGATPSLLDVLPSAQMVFVVRHPVQNIRSILDRVNLPGTPHPLDQIDGVDDGWAPIITGSEYNISAPDHITALAKRWTYLNSMYLRHRDALRLVRYEDFMSDKVQTIHALADDLDVPIRQDIRPYVDVAFQPRGAHRDIPPSEFFSADALTTIESHCAETMSALDYTPSAGSSL